MNHGDERDLEQGYGTFTEPKRCLGLKQPRPLRRPSRKLADWMALLEDDTPLSAVTIPGTHDSAAYTYSWPFVATQKMDIIEQLDAGIRYFDFRCAVRDDVVHMVHGVKYLGLKLEMVLEGVYAWLGEHPSEALIVQIKKDRKAQNSEVHFSNAISKVLATNPKRWRTANMTSSIGQLRGRIQLLRRFVWPRQSDYGINVSQWVDNPEKPFTIRTKHHVQITIQDHYTFADRETLHSLVAKKGGDVVELLERASRDAAPLHWYINFTSAYEINVVYQITPHEIAVGARWWFHWEDGMNVLLRSYLQARRKRKRRFGIVAMDFPEQGADDLIGALVQSNFEPNRSGLWEYLAFGLPVTVLFLIFMTGYWMLMRKIVLE